MAKTARQITLPASTDPRSTNLQSYRSPYRRTRRLAAAPESRSGLALENRRDPIAPDRFDRRKDAGLVVDEDVVLGRMPALDVRPLLFLMDLDQHVALKSVP